MGKTKNSTSFTLYKWTLSYFKPFLFYTLVFVICGGIMIYGELAIPRRMGYLIDNVSQLKDTGLLKKEILILTALAAVIILVKSIYYLLEQVIVNKIIKNQQMDLIRKLQTLGFSYYEKVSTANILFIFENAVTQVQKTYNFLFPQFIYSFVQFVVPSIILIINVPIFFVASMVGNIIYVLINGYANKKIEYYLDLETKADETYQNNLYNAISATNELKVTGASDWFLNRTIKSFDEYRIQRMWSIFWRHYRFSSVGFSLTISIVLFYFLGFKLIQTGQLTVGDFVGYSFLMGLMSRGFSVFFYIVPAQKHALKYAQYIYDFLQLEPEVEDNGNKELDKSDLNMVLKDISFKYSEAEDYIIKNISLDIPTGKKVALVGESGSGKTTLLKLIGRFYDVTSGEISIGTQNIKNLSLVNLRENLAYVFQETQLFNMSIKDNIKFGNFEATDEEIIEVAKLANIHEFIIGTENGYDTIIGESGVSLSGGQKQRLSLARMLLKNSPIVLLDEATSALDNITEENIKNSLDLALKDKTVITVAHKLSTIKDYDLIVVINKGEIAEQGDYDTLMSNKSLFYNLVIRGDEDGE